MKILYLILFLILSGSNFCQAQQESGKLQLGLQLGPTHTFYRGADTYTDYKSDFRGAAGFSLRYQLKRIFLKADLLYENKGVKYKTYDYTALNPDYIIDYYNPEKNNTAKRHLHFITLPILVGLPIKQTGFYINAGPYVGWKLKQGYSFEKGEANSSVPEDRLDFGIVTGIGYTRPLSPDFEISAEIRHNYGLYNVDGYRPDEKYANSTSLLFGIHYTL